MGDVLHRYATGSFTSTSVTHSENQSKKATETWNASRMTTFQGHSAKLQ